MKASAAAGALLFEKPMWSAKRENAPVVTLRTPHFTLVPK